MNDIEMHIPEETLKRREEEKTLKSRWYFTTVVVIGIVAMGLALMAFLYMRMQTFPQNTLSKQELVTDDEATTTNTNTVTKDSSREEKLQFIGTLSTTHASSTELEERQRVLEGLRSDANDTNTEVSEEEKLNILRSLSGG